MKKIVLTGGGTAGHVTPNIALLPGLLEQGFEVSYIGSKAGIEKELIAKAEIPYYGISSGKLRRYLSLTNLTDLLRIVKGLGEAMVLMKKLKPDIVFSKGGFVIVPVVIAAKLAGVPVILHESDITPGLANKISIPFAKKICASFPETINYLPAKKGVLTGSPIRQSLFEGDRTQGYKRFRLDTGKPVLLVMGGSLGSVAINQALRSIIHRLDFNVIHLCGRNNVDEEIYKNKNISPSRYLQFEYLSDGLNDAFACADMIVSRAGANSIFEFLALKKPNLLIPLSRKASRGDQILNAQSFEKQGFSKVLAEEALEGESLYDCIMELYRNRNTYIDTMTAYNLGDGVGGVLKVIAESIRE